MGHIARGLLAPLAEAPVLTPADVSAIRRDPAPLLAFHMAIFEGGDLLLEPFAGVHDARYAVHPPSAE